MTVDIAIVLGVVVVAVILFATEKMSVDLVALSVIAFFMLTGIITPMESVSGFSNSATVTVAAMFVISAGLFKTGVVNYVGNYVTGMFKVNFWIAITAMMIVAGVFSAFLNNTPIVAIFIPILLGVSSKLNISASKLLMPLSFASMFGGVCTLIGTSTNILVSSIAKEHGLPAFGMFEFTGLGLVFFGVGILYMLFFGIRLIPDRRVLGDLTDSFGMSEYLTEIILMPGARSIGKRVIDSPLVKDLGVSIVEIQRKGKVFIPNAYTELTENDILRIRSSVEKIKEVQEREGVELKYKAKLQDADLQADDIILIEAIISPNSFLIGKSLKTSNFRNRYRGLTIALRHSGRAVMEKLGATRLRAGDALLIEVRKENLNRFSENSDFVFVNEVALPVFKKDKIIPALAIVTGVVTTAALGILPILASAIIGAVLLVLIRCISLEDAYKAIEWRVIFLLAGAITLGVALEKTGAAAYVANGILSSIGSWGPFVLVSVFYLLTSLLTDTMSNNATAVLITPIAIVAAESMGISVRPLLVAVMFAASSSFMTPVGYQTNTMIYSAGRYKFIDFIKVGAPLNFIFWLLASLLIPVFFPF